MASFSPYVPAVPNPNTTSMPTFKMPEGGWGNTPIPQTPYTPEGWAGHTPNEAKPWVDGQIEKYGAKGREAYKGEVDKVNKTLLDALPFIAGGGTLLAALYGQDNDTLWGTKAEANDAAAAGVKADPIT